MTEATTFTNGESSSFCHFLYLMTPHLRFLGPRMIYTCGIVLDLEKEETLEQLQDNKLTVVCEKLGLKPGDRLLDIGCGWGTLVAFAAKNYGVDATGVTLARKQTAFGNARIKANGVDPSKARILCKDFRDVKDGPGSFNKIVSLEMAEVCINNLPLSTAS
jgi:cyclopropane fatty-acyl-phospholipid synthase-like methyltransferase